MNGLSMFRSSSTDWLLEELIVILIWSFAFAAEFALDDDSALLVDMMDVDDAFGGDMVCLDVTTILDDMSATQSSNWAFKMLGALNESAVETENRF